VTQTPAQAYGHPTLDDVPVSGPTDPGIWTADCWFRQNRIPAHSTCVDCEGSTTMQQVMRSTGIGERISFGGGGALGFAIGVGAPDVWTTLSTAQQTWVMNTLVTLDGLIKKQTGTSCPTFGPSITAAGACFKGWFNGAKLGLTKPDGSPLVLDPTTTFDQATLDALRTVAAMNPKDFTTPFPGTEMAGTTGTTKKLSTGEIVGIGAGVATVAGGIIYLVTRKGGRRKGRKGSRRR
jgi:hypothetical protein